MASTLQQLTAELVDAGRALSRANLVTAFGHVSGRLDANRLVITPPMPLGRLTAESSWTELDITATDLAPGVPREAWIHLAIAQRRPDVGGICRAQPEVATALASAGVPIIPLHGQGSYLGPQVPVFNDALLIRDPQRGAELAETLGAAPGLILLGNGAVTVGATIGEAVARMWVLEASARLNATAAAAGTPHPLSDDEQAYWRSVGTELLGRIWADLRLPAPA